MISSPTAIDLHSNFLIFFSSHPPPPQKMMNTSSTTNASSSSSSSEQCESGWTLYLDYSTQFHNNGAKSHHHHHHHHHHQIPCCDRFYNHHNDEDDEEEDLSMVSDASSGPPHLEEDAAEDVFCYGGAGGRKRGTSSETEISRHVKVGRRRFEREDFALDDTASSHPTMNVIFSSKRNGGVENQASPIKGLIDYSSQGFSATHFQVLVESRKRR